MAEEKNKAYLDAEKEAATAFPSNDSECEVLCLELQDAVDELRTAEGIERRRLLARIRALRARRTELRCGLCLPR